MQFRIFTIDGKQYALNEDWQEKSCRCTLSAPTTFIESKRAFICQTCSRLIGEDELVMREMRAASLKVPSAAHVNRREV